jgi:septum formation protein
MLVLASASPRRQELLKAAGISFEVQPADVLEVPRSGESPKSFAERMACEKAQVVARQRHGDFILGADTIVVVDDQILGKPKDASDAARMLRLLSGRKHEVMTAVCLLDPRKETAVSFADVRCENTIVTMDAISEPDILGYVASGEPMDKAGAYAIQGMASRWIPRIEGDYTNVVGLPVGLVFRMLREHGAV